MLEELLDKVSEHLQTYERVLSDIVKMLFVWIFPLVCFEEAVNQALCGVDRMNECKRKDSFLFDKLSI